MKQFSKYIILIISWLILPPVFYILSKRWSGVSKKKGIILSLLSPMSIIFILLLIAILAFGVWYLMNYYHCKTHFTDRETIENITGIKVPPFKIVEYNEGETAFNGDHSDEVHIRFNDSIPAEIFNQIDHLIELDNTSWQKRNKGIYHFSTMWGNGIQAPKGEDESDDGTFSIELRKGSMDAVITHGSW